MSSSIHTAEQQTPGRQDGREVEWQLASSDLGSVRRWLSDHGTIDGLVLEPRSTLQIVDIYLDTDDWRIHRAGFALRIRSESGKSEATLKSLHSAGAEPADRRELSEPLASAASESIRRSVGPVGTRVHAVSGAHALLPLFEVRTSRQRFAIRKEDEVLQLGEIALDDTVIARPHGEPQSSMQRVEVEALTTPHEPLRSLVKTLQSHCALAAASDTKYSQGLKSVGLSPGPAPQFGPTAIDASMPMADVALANLRRYLTAWHLHEPGARLGDDPEALHDLRVAARRMDAILREFQSSLPAPFRRLRPTLKRILRALGDARDLDVALGELDTFCGTAPAADRQSVEPLKQHLAAERRRARTRMLRILDSAAVQEKLQRLTALLATPAGSPLRNSPEPALDVAPDLIRRRYRKLRKGADPLTADSPVEDFHAVRGHVKKLRYLLEAVAGLYGKPAAQMLRALCRWQEKLGVQQDAAVANRRLQALAGAPPKGLPPETLFVMGRFAEHYASVAGRGAQAARQGLAKNS